jgi:hypothetical protein
LQSEGSEGSKLKTTIFLDRELSKLETGTNLEDDGDDDETSLEIRRKLI